MQSKAMRVHWHMLKGRRKIIRVFVVQSCAQGRVHFFVIKNCAQEENLTFLGVVFKANQASSSKYVLFLLKAKKLV